MIRVQHHRGPDAEGVATPDAYLALSHARLSIVDLTDAGSQPFVFDGHALVFNGEIYNHAALRPELERLGAKFRGTSDTATLFEALRLWGVEPTLRKIRGMFAFAYYQTQQRTLYLCRDRLGIKPLHYLVRNGNVFFSSEIKGIAAATPLTLDPIRTVFAISSVADDSLDRTPFRGVYQVQPGSMLVCRPGAEPALQFYYQPIDDVDEGYYRELDSTPEDVIVSRFSELLNQSVSSMLMSDAPLGVFVSGGIDSSVLAVLAAKSLPKLPLFSSNVVGPDSEIEDARALARVIGSPIHESDFQPGDFLREWARATWHYECPIVRHMSSVPLCLVSEVARDQGIKVALTGEGSDELLLGYPKHVTQRYDRLARKPVDTLLSMYGWLPGLREHLWPDTKDQPDHFINLLAQDFQRQRLREIGLPKLSFLGDEDARTHYLTLQMLQEHLQSLLHRNDRMGMSRSIETRFPFLDEELVRFAINLPVKFKIHRSMRMHNYKHPFLEDKWILRRMARDLLPKPLVVKPKNGFPVAGYNTFRVKPSFFAGGWVEEAIGLSRAAIDYVARNIKPMFVARLAAVDVFGRMFENGWSVDKATEHASRHITVA